MKVMTIRLDDDRAALLELIARVDSTPIVKAIEAGIDALAALRRADPEFRRQLQGLLGADRTIARHLLTEETPDV